MMLKNIKDKEIKIVFKEENIELPIDLEGI